MTRRALGPSTVAVVLAALVLLTSCAETTIDPAATSAPEARPTTVFAPAGTTADLLAEIAAETGGLSARLVDNDGQRESLARIEVLWALARPDIDEERPELVNGFDRVIELVRTSVERRRPADADKAHKNLMTLIAAYEG